MLKGFTVPLTPAGKPPLATLPPWHYSSDCIAIEYWTDPAAIAALLPPGLALDEKSGGRAFFWFLDWQFTGSNDELTDPARYQYREAFALVELLPFYLRRQRLSAARGGRSAQAAGGRADDVAHG